MQKLENSNAEISKYSFIRNKFVTHWIYIGGPIYVLFE